MDDLEKCLNNDNSISKNEAILRSQIIDIYKDVCGSKLVEIRITGDLETFTVRVTEMFVVVEDDDETVSNCFNVADVRALELLDPEDINSLGTIFTDVINTPLYEVNKDRGITIFRRLSNEL